MSDGRTATCVVVAGGSGTRLPGAVEKQFQLLAGKTVLAHALLAVEASPEVGAIILVVPPGRVEHARTKIVAAHKLAKVAAVVEGGPTRAASVRLGLAAVRADVDWVCVHDAARPLATPALFARVLAGAAATGAAVPALPIADTIKRVEAGRVIETVDRAGLWSVQTPQAFGQRTLLEAHARAERSGEDASDCALLVERAGGTVSVVAGEPWNIKITEPADLALAAAILAARKGGS